VGKMVDVTGLAAAGLIRLALCVPIIVATVTMNNPILIARVGLVFCHHLRAAAIIFVSRAHAETIAVTIAIVQVLHAVPMVHVR